MRNLVRILISLALVLACSAAVFALGDKPSVDAHVNVPPEADGGSVLLAVYDAN